MSKSDHEFFNCSEDYEVAYVANQYVDPASTKKFIVLKCSNGTISNWTHAKLYEYLNENGYTKK